MNNQSRVLPVLFGTLLIDMIGFGMVFPIIPILFTDPSSPSFVLHGYSQSMQFLIAGSVTALWGVTQFVAAPILGELSDVYGRKKLLVTGVGILALSQFLFAFGVEAGSVALLLTARAIAGIAAGNAAIAQATIADVTAPKDRAKSFGLIGAAFGLGFILGPLISGWITGISHNAALTFYVAGALGVANVLFVAVFLGETNTSRNAQVSFTLLKGVRNIGAAIDDGQARPIYAASFLYLFGFAFLPPFYGIWLVNALGFDAAQVGMAFAGVGLCAAFAQLVVLRWLTKRFTERQILRFSIVCVGVCMGLFSFFPYVWVVILALPLIAIPQGLTMANLAALVSRSVAANKQGVALGINGSLLALGNALAPLLAGAGSAALGIHTPFVAGAIAILASWAVLFLGAARRAPVPAS